jgi:hypothetical protein
MNTSTSTHDDDDTPRVHSADKRLPPDAEYVDQFSLGRMNFRLFAADTGLLFDHYVLVTPDFLSDRERWLIEENDLATLIPGLQAAKSLINYMHGDGSIGALVSRLLECGLNAPYSHFKTDRPSEPRCPARTGRARRSE